jgi:hypothetical protein
VLVGDQGHPTWARTWRKLDKAFLWEVRAAIVCRGNRTNGSPRMVGCPADRTLPGIGEAGLGWVIGGGESRGLARRPRRSRLDGWQEIILEILTMVVDSLNLRGPIGGGPRPNYRPELTARRVLPGANLLWYVISCRRNSPLWLINPVSRLMRHIYRRQGTTIRAVSMVR